MSKVIKYLRIQRQRELRFVSSRPSDRFARRAEAHPPPCRSSPTRRRRRRIWMLTPQPRSRRRIPSGSPSMVSFSPLPTLSADPISPLASPDPSPFLRAVLELMREAQMQHGLRHGDYTRYRCASRFPIPPHLTPTQICCLLIFSTVPCYRDSRLAGFTRVY